jgi:hypothetical protein
VLVIVAAVTRSFAVQRPPAFEVASIKRGTATGVSRAECHLAVGRPQPIRSAYVGEAEPPAED